MDIVPFEPPQRARSVLSESTNSSPGTASTTTEPPRQTRVDAAPSYAVGVVNYRGYADLERCLCAVATQTLSAVTVHVVDGDAEPDAHEAIARRAAKATRICWAEVLDIAGYVWLGSISGMHSRWGSRFLLSWDRIGSKHPGRLGIPSRSESRVNQQRR